jgi:chromosome segregation ATPase
MTTRDAMERFIREANEKLEAARKELEETNRNGFQVDAEYTSAQIALEQLEREIEHMKISANAQQKEQLHRLHLQASHLLNDMYLDENDLEQYK